MQQNVFHIVLNETHAYASNTVTDTLMETFPVVSLNLDFSELIFLQNIQKGT